MSPRGVWIWGVGLIAIGLFLLSVNLRLIPLGEVPILPLLVLLLGAWLTLDAGRRPRGRGLTAGIVVMAAGAFWMAVSLGWLQEEQFLAVLLIALGLGVLLRSAAFGRR